MSQGEIVVPLAPELASFINPMTQFLSMPAIVALFAHKLDLTQALIALIQPEELSMKWASKLIG
jgi:hypothetical protein